MRDWIFSVYIYFRYIRRQRHRHCSRSTIIDSNGSKYFIRLRTIFLLSTVRKSLYLLPLAHTCHLNYGIECEEGKRANEWFHTFYEMREIECANWEEKQPNKSNNLRFFLLIYFRYVDQYESVGKKNRFRFRLKWNSNQFKRTYYGNVWMHNELKSMRCSVVNEWRIPQCMKNLFLFSPYGVAQSSDWFALSFLLFAIISYKIS